MNCKGYGKKRSWPDWSYAVICPQELRKSKQNLIQVRQSSNPVLNHRIRGRAGVVPSASTFRTLSAGLCTKLIRLTHKKDVIFRYMFYLPNYWNGFRALIQAVYSKNLIMNRISSAQPLRYAHLKSIFICFPKSFTIHGVKPMRR